MSTAGKILSFVVVLAVLGWIALFAMVTDLNKNWGERIVALTKDVERLEAQLPKVSADLNEKLAELTREQVKVNDAVTLFRTRLSDMEKLDTQSREALDRIKFQLASSEASIKSAQATLTFRKDEHAKTDKDLANERERVEKLKSDVSASMNQLASLRDKFKTLLAENKRMVQELESKSQKPGPRVSPATFRGRGR